MIPYKEYDVRTSEKKREIYLYSIYNVYTTYIMLSVQVTVLYIGVLTCTDVLLPARKKCSNYFLAFLNMLERVSTRLQLPMNQPVEPIYSVDSQNLHCLHCLHLPVN